MKDKWEKFEELVCEVQKKLSPDAVVKHNDHIIGAQSKTKRQIDISIRYRVGQYEILIVIDCKDYSTPVDIKSVESFIGLAKDVLYKPIKVQWFQQVALLLAQK